MGKWYRLEAGSDLTAAGRAQRSEPKASEDEFALVHSAMFPIWKLPQLVTRPWRLCRELDDYDDVECAAFARSVQSARLLGLVLAVPIVIVGGAGLAIATGGVMPNVPMEETTPAERALYAVVIVAIFVFTLSAALLPYLLIVRWELKRQIERVVCPSCRYSLLGLPVEAGAATCPECGEHFKLTDYGFRPEDLLTGARKRARRADAPSTKRWTRVLNICFCIWVIACLAYWIAIGGGALASAGFGTLVWIVAHAYHHEWFSRATKLPDEK